MEVAAALELQPNGRFRYGLSYGAMDEQAEGDWVADGSTVRLTSNPMPKEPSFELVRDEPAPKGELFITLEKTDFGWGGPLHALARLAGDTEPALIVADEEGRVRSAQANRHVGAAADADVRNGGSARLAQRRPRPPTSVSLSRQRFRDGGLRESAVDAQRC